MATAQPIGWTVGAGVWDTDVETSTAWQKSGDASIHFLATTPAADPQLNGELQAAEPDQPWMVYGWVRADSNSAANKLWVVVAWYDKAGTLLATSTVTNTACAAANTDERRSGVVTSPAAGDYATDVAFAQVIFGKTKTAFQAWFDGVDFRPALRLSRVSASTGSFASGVIKSLYTFTAKRYGAHLVRVDGGETASASYFSPNAYWWVNCDVNGLPGFDLYSYEIDSRGNNWKASTTEILILNPGDSVTLEVSHTNSENLNLGYTLTFAEVG